MDKFIYCYDFIILNNYFNRYIVRFQFDYLIIINSCYIINIYFIYYYFMYLVI